MRRYRVLFYSNASAQVGFGHLRRCLFLRKDLQERGVDDVAFAGEFDEDAKALIKDEAPSAPCLRGLNGVKSDVVVIDYMFDPKEMEAYDVSLISEVANGGREAVLISSAATIPRDLPVDVAIGHLLNSDRHTSFELKTGLKYAPVAPEVESYRPSEPRGPENVNRVFIGLGNSDDPAGIHLALRALREVDYKQEVDLLLPPALVGRAGEFESQDSGFDLSMHHSIPSVPALLTKADLMIGSYGHMTFESLALGVPTVIIGMKEFMVEYADQLASQKVSVSVGHVDDLLPNDVAAELNRLDRNRRHALSRNSLSLVDGGGLRRVGREIVKRVRD
ncbi:spore coat polysaccharide biosynthesis predicted glycosyltransferase SpsG [Salinibacter ruber]|uniref:hypothetical protein n=1 Tax=Salinibacter ruber TaxID=146919 RepID=UPI00216A762C|nr:hypothetical protein [Salinibacter ruber]MCS3955391.1 spore coat polysaccharide biosynthesis predicted glycosyltransferase SpsG [Salinibacter ruber]